MKNKKAVWIVVGVVLLLAIALAAVLAVNAGKNAADNTSAPQASNTASHTITWFRGAGTTTAATQNGQSTAASDKTTVTTSKTTANASSASQDIPTKNEIISLGIGGGGFYYAVGYKSGDEAMKDTVAAALYRLEKNGALKPHALEWFYEQIYPRDGRHTVPATADRETLKRCMKDGVTIGVFDGNAPLASFENGKAVGYEIDVATACFDVYHITPKFVAVTADNAAAMLADGSVDLLWGGLRDGAIQGILYSDVNEWNLENEMCYYTVSGSRYRGETALLEETKKIGVVKGTLCESFVKDRLQTAGYTDKTTEYATVKEAFAALKSGDVDCVACDYLTVYAMWKNVFGRNGLQSRR